jgi:hypothetical protein
VKFAYVDETGDSSQGGVFVMCSSVIDAYRIKKYTAKFDQMLSNFLAKHPRSRDELKTKAFINGNDGWSKIDANERKKFLCEICDLAAECAKIFSIAVSFNQFVAADAAHGDKFSGSYWLAAAMFVAAIVQKNAKNGKKQGAYRADLRR